MSGTPQIQMPATLIIEVVPDINRSGGKATLLARDWVVLAAADLRIVPTRGDVHYNSENDSFKIEITLAPMRTKPQPPLDPPLIILP